MEDGGCVIKMAIAVGENPEGLPGVNKFIAKSGDGQRGRILALHRDRTKAIVLAMNNSRKKDVQWGRFYLVREQDSAQYPRVVRRVTAIPDSDEWEIVDWQTVLPPGDSSN